MDYQALIIQLEDPAALPMIAQSLDSAAAAELIEYLKAAADRHWRINANRSLELADLILRIGQARGDTCQMALGTMARGDALKLLGRTEDAWATLGRAGDLFQACGDEIGWARTRIGRLLICFDLNRVDAALADAERANTIFIQHNLHEKRLVLDLNTALVHTYLGNQRHALAQFQAALALAETLGAAGESWIGPIYTNIGLVFEALGDFRQSLACYERANAIFARRNEPNAAAITEQNIAFIAQAQGHYRRALHLLHRVHDLMVAASLPIDATHVSRDMIECYLHLNHYAEARDLAEHVVAQYRSYGTAYYEARTLLLFAIATAELAHFEVAQAALDQAEPIFTALGSAAWVATTRLRRGRIALQQGAHAAAAHAAAAAAVYFDANGQQVEHAAATLLWGQAVMIGGDTAAAAIAGARALRVAQSRNVPRLRYTAHLLLGRVAEAQGRTTRAIRRYRAGAATVERVQRSLTITLRPGFLEDKSEALRALIGLYLQDGRAERAFESLERAKSQTLLGYLANRGQLRWSSDDPRSRALIAELDQLREEHQWFYRLAHEQPTDAASRPGRIEPQQALAEVATRERRMRTITEQLYLHSGESQESAHVSAPPLHEIQHGLSEDTLLIEFYNDGTSLWAFTLDTTSLQVHRLPISVAAVDQLLAQLQLNLAAALKAGPASPVTRNLAGIAQRILQRLYAGLLRPLEQRMHRRGRLAVVPYGALHYLPFHLLHTGAQYLIEQHEVVVFPAAGLVTRHGPVRPRGALALAHSSNGQLPQTLAEAQIVQNLFGGVICRNEAANRAALRAQPTQILHIAAHGEHRLDQPDLSFIQLADGQLYADDLLQHDLSYELVTLSACETGRANVAAGDELIGLGRGVLYAGAGALIVSLWRVTDESAVALMERVYRALSVGASKAAALRGAQSMAIKREPQLHPAFWGAFQLIGDASPLSKEPTLGLKGA